MAARVKFVPSPALQAARKLGRTPQMAAALRTYANAALEGAKQFAPRGDSPIGEGYADQLEANVGPSGKTGRGVFIGRVNAKKFTSHWIEFGTGPRKGHPGTPMFAPLRRGLASIGFKVFERRRRQ